MDLADLLNNSEKPGAGSSVSLTPGLGKPQPLNGIGQVAKLITRQSGLDILARHM
jgi:hypothetical protein